MNLTNKKCALVLYSCLFKTAANLFECQSENVALHSQKSDRTFTQK